MTVERELAAAKEAWRKAHDSELRIAARLDEMTSALDGMIHPTAGARDRAIQALHNARVAIRASHLFPLVLCARTLIAGDDSPAVIEQAKAYARAGLVWSGVA